MDNDKSEEESKEVTPEGAKEVEKQPEQEQPKQEVSVVPLQDYTRTKDVLHRVAERILSDEQRLAELASEDPKLLERIKLEFPKKFKDVRVESKVTDEDLSAKIQAEVEKHTSNLGRGQTMDALRQEIGMTPLEFEDIRSSISESADKMMRLEMADSYKDAVLLAYKNLNPRKYEEVIAKRALKSLSERKDLSSSGQGTSVPSKSIPEKVLKNWKKLGFSGPEEMMKYMGSGKIDISQHIMPKKWSSDNY